MEYVTGGHANGIMAASINGEMAKSNIEKAKIMASAKWRQWRGEMAWRSYRKQSAAWQLEEKLEGNIGGNGVAAMAYEENEMKSKAKKAINERNAILKCRKKINRRQCEGENNQ